MRTTLTKYTEADNTFLHKYLDDNYFCKYTNTGKYRWRALLGVMPSQLFVLKFGDTPIGFGVGRRKRNLKKFWQKEVWFYGIFVCPEFRSQGFGRELMLHLETAYIHTYYLCLYVDADNIVAQNLYRSLGFEHCGNRGNQFIMKKIQK